MEECVRATRRCAWEHERQLRSTWARRTTVTIRDAAGAWATGVIRGCWHDAIKLVKSLFRPGGCRERKEKISWMCIMACHRKLPNQSSGNGRARQLADWSRSLPPPPTHNNVACSVRTETEMYYRIEKQMVFSTLGFLDIRASKREFEITNGTLVIGSWSLSRAGVGWWSWFSSKILASVDLSVQGVLLPSDSVPAPG